MQAPVPPANNPPRTVSELSFAPKRTLEDRIARLRLRGGNSRVTHLAFGHIYLTLDGDKAAVEGAHRSGRPPQQSEIR